MKIIDTHNHLYLEEFDADREQLVDEALASGIDTLLLPNVDLTTVDRMHALCDSHPGFAFPMMGLHPTSVDAAYTDGLKKIEAYLSRRSYCGIGEIGVDLYWDTTYRKEQLVAFEEQLRWSIDLDLPVAIHTRQAFPEVFECLYKVGPEKLKGVFHSFTGTEEELTEINKLDTFLIGINGVVTFKNSELPRILPSVKIEKVVLETDAPYLAPVPYRGKRNEPAYIRKTAEKVAQVYGRTVEETIKTTRKNALNLFQTVNKSI